MLSPKIDGRILHFRLIGINNQNFLMKDEETGSWWQQVSGAAIAGPMKGKRLAQIFHDELSFATWKKETAEAGRVLRPNADTMKQERYAKSNWEERLARLPVPAPFQKKNIFEPREIIIGVVTGKIAKAYAFTYILRNRIVMDRIGETSLLFIVAEDDRSVRCYNTTVNGHPLEFFLIPDPRQLRMRDSSTGSVWDFTGKALSGSLKGQQLEKIAMLKDYWFDWKNYHPQTLIFKQ